MKVYCPCEKKCRGFSGSPRKCERVGGPTAIMPQEFNEQNMDQTEGSFSKMLVGGLGIFGSTLMEKAGAGKLTYQVWRCPACKCKVLTSSMKAGNGVTEDEAGAIRRCR
jgi:hypothetical protein